jgi:hypothetical protein|tara:strand:+ start:19472 stop:19801 length:330 start_codon:yes stop_codon:yes gene_type:complete
MVLFVGVFNSDGLDVLSELVFPDKSDPPLGLAGVRSNGVTGRAGKRMVMERRILTIPVGVSPWSDVIDEKHYNFIILARLQDGTIDSDAEPIPPVLSGELTNAGVARNI